MDQMNALTIVIRAVDDSDFRPGIVEACRVVLVNGLATTLPGRYGRFIHAIMTNPSVCAALEEMDE